MRMTCKTLWLALPLAVSALSAQAAAAGSPLGRWKTIDDRTGQVKSIVEIRQAADGTLTGRVVEILQSDQGPNPVCERCEGTRRNRPIKGMTILWNLRQDDARHWSGGSVLDPAKGKTYASKLALHPDGRKLDLSGCIAFLCRSQTWLRE